MQAHKQFVSSAFIIMFLVACENTNPLENEAVAFSTSSVDSSLEAAGTCNTMFFFNECRAVEHVLVLPSACTPAHFVAFLRATILQKPYNTFSTQFSFPSHNQNASAFIIAAQNAVTSVTVGDGAAENVRVKHTLHLDTSDPNKTKIHGSTVLEPCYALEMNDDLPFAHKQGAIFQIAHGFLDFYESSPSDACPNPNDPPNAD